MLQAISQSTRAHTHTTHQPRLARLCLETLEDRTTPSTLSISIEYTATRAVVISGFLYDTPTPANQNIQLNGVVNGTATTDSIGYYEVQLEASGVGTVAGQATGSNMAFVYVTDEAPVITAFDAIEQSTAFWFSGTTTYGRPFTNLKVYWGGQPVSLQGKMDITNDDGDITTAWGLNGTVTDNGDVWVEVESVFGLRSAKAWDVIHQTGT